jgi:MSHA pilin protein MshC
MAASARDRFVKTCKQSGFSLVELIAVLIIASIIFIYIGDNSGQRGLELQSTRDDVIAGLFYAQQIAMARQNNSNPVRFVSDGISTVDIQESGASVNGDGYPLTLPVGFTLSSATLNYDKLGRTTPTTLTLSGSGSSVNITIESSGYVH